VDLYTLLIFVGQGIPTLDSSSLGGVNSGVSTLGSGLLLGGGFPLASFRFGLGRFPFGFGIRFFPRLLPKLRRTPRFQFELVRTTDDQRCGTPVDVYDPYITRL
jgi:hypothetical protein